jgi:hypothetical protein
VDPNSGIVYLTEDSTPSGFYRYLPNTQGTPHDGGELQMLLVETSDGRSYTTYTDGTGIEYFTSWVTIDYPDYAAGETRPALQGQAKGPRCSAGSRVHGGKPPRLHRLDQRRSDQPRPGVRVRPSNRDHARVVRLPRRVGAEQPGQHLRQPTRRDRPMEGRQRRRVRARADHRRGDLPVRAKRRRDPSSRRAGQVRGPRQLPGSEWCGSTFEPRNGNWLFVNVQSPDITFAITGPWRRGSERPQALPTERDRRRRWRLLHC